MNTCKTCKHWVAPTHDDHRAYSLCNPLDPQNDFEPMQRGFEVRKCAQPTQTFAESPVERNGFGMVDGSEYYSVLVTAEDFGCVRHEAADRVKEVPPSPAMDPQRLRELADPSHAAFEEAMRQTFQMVDPFNPPPPGSYARGSHEGICAALKTMRENYDRARRASGVAPCDLCAKGFPVKDGQHYGTQALGMIPTTPCTAGVKEDQRG